MQTSSTLIHAQSFHPIFKTTIHPPSSSQYDCSIHLLYRFPALIIVDPYELDNRAASYSFQHAGPSNLELPVVAFDPTSSNSSLLLTLVVDHGLDVEVPLHVRYGPVDKGSSPAIIRTEVPWPEVFYACLDNSPSDETLPPMPREFASSFQGKTIHRIPAPENALRVETVETPVGNAGDVRTVEMGTAVVIIVSFVYLLRAMQRAFRRLNTGTASKEKVE
ncbi:PIG-X [Mycena amicta]|nr:PIG-X [Mycena amicta]